MRLTGSMWGGGGEGVVGLSERPGELVGGGGGGGGGFARGVSEGVRGSTGVGGDSGNRLAELLRQGAPCIKDGHDSTQLKTTNGQ